MTARAAALPQLWLARTDIDAAALEHRLDAVERDQLLRIPRPEERRRRAAAWSLRRWALSRAQPAVRETDWRFTAGLFGKPELAAPFGPLDLHHSLSHGGAFAAVLVAHTPCGVDVEPPPVGRDAGEVVFSPQERAAIAAHARPDGRFLQHWVAKEAVLKLVGTGLGDGPERLSLTLSADGREARVQATAVALPSRLAIRLWPLPDGHWLAAAFEGPAPDLRPQFAPLF